MKLVAVVRYAVTVAAVAWRDVVVADTAGAQDSH